MAKSDKKNEKKTSKAALEKSLPVKPKPATAREILAKAKAQAPHNGKEKKIDKPVPKSVSKDSSDSSDSDSESGDELIPMATNGKTKEISPEENSESSSEDEKPKASQVKAIPKNAASSSSESDSDSEDQATPPKPQLSTSKPAPAPLQSKAVPPAKSASSSSDSDSDSESESVTASVAAKAKVSHASPSSEESDDSDSDSDSKPGKKVPSGFARNTEISDSSSSEESSESDSDSDSDSGVKSKPTAATTKKANSSSSEGSDSSSGDEDVKMADSSTTTPKTAANGKRKADAEQPQSQAKKTKFEQPTQETKSIFVGRLSWSIDSDRLAQEFAHCGEVVSATVQTDRNTGKSRGFGYVHFTTAEAVEKALEMNNQEIDGRTINVDRSTPPDPNQTREKRSKSFNDSISPPSRTLFVANLPFSITEDSLWSYFEGYSVKTIRLPTDRDTGAPKGFGYVELEDVENAKKAFEALTGTEIEGRRIRLDYSQPRDNFGGGDRGRGGGDRGRSGGDRGRGGRGGGRGWGDRGRGGDRGFRGRGRGAPRGNARSGGIAVFEGTKMSF